MTSQLCIKNTIFKTAYLRNYYHKFQYTKNFETNFSKNTCLQISIVSITKTVITISHDRLQLG